ncbi:MAG: PSD1 domain-containing protein [Planctomycetales bacterium]|nr:PSD1 domain-containing protein [Planctomycetales bacterium]
MIHGRVARSHNTNACRKVALLVIGLACIGQASDIVSANDKDRAERAFTLEVLPLLRQKCLGCHGGNQRDIKGGFSVVDRERLLRGGESGEPAVVPMQAGAGTLLAAVRWEDLEMPPKENDRLTGAQIATVERWIKAGAPWPSEAIQARYREEDRQVQAGDGGVMLKTSGGVSAEWTNRRYAPVDLWAFRPVRRLSSTERLQLLKDAGLETSDKNHNGDNGSQGDDASLVDALLLRRIREAGLTPAGRADARTLIRRATFDLHGLPPTPEEVEAFIAANQRDPQVAWTDLIDRLLASPRYGERWGRHWLDVTRYADTGGMSNDYERSNMWRYRDYVIRAFNSDKPYNEFVVEQLAGDELADQSVRTRLTADEARVHRIQQTGEYTEQEAEWIVATGFLRLGPWDNAMVEPEAARQIWLDDLVNITGQAFLSTTMRCVKCHDHKFDPIPTRDYYRMYAAFSTTHMAERPAPLLAVESQSGFESGREHVQRMLDFAVAEKNRIVEKREAAARKWFEERGLPYRDEQQRKALPDEEKPPRHVGLDFVDEGQLKVREQDEWIWTRRLERYEPLAQSVYNAAATELAWNGARKLRIKRKADPRTTDSQLPECHILAGGSLAAPGEVVQPGVLSAVSVEVAASHEDPYLLTEAIDGRRLGLAQWIVDPENSLTTRSIVNRIWQGHFGAGIAANPNNFGAKGGKPTHPELLDFLAADFVTNGWKVKRLHRLLMLTQAYQRSSRPADDDWKEVDPVNRLLSHFERRRLSAEELRDGVLSVTAELRHREGGLPIRPEINMEVALQPRMIQFSLAPAYQPSRTPAERNGRSVYAYQVRGQADPFSELFNQPNPNESCELRESAAATPQAFTLLNSDMMSDRSMAFALRLEREAKTPAQRIQRGFLLTLGRAPTTAEMERLTRYASDMVAYHRRTPAAPVTYPTEITRSLVEEFSGKSFEYREILPIFANYMPDKKAVDVSPETRALADVCLLLLNANEFIYVN